MKRILITQSPGNHIAFSVWEEANKPVFLNEYAVVAECLDQNTLRRRLGILRRLKAVGNTWHDFVILRKPADGSHKKPYYHLLVCLWSWKEKASYYAGMIYAAERLKRKKRVRNRITTQ